MGSRNNKPMIAVESGRSTGFGIEVLVKQSSEECWLPHRAVKRIQDALCVDRCADWLFLPERKFAAQNKERVFQLLGV